MCMDQQPAGYNEDRGDHGTVCRQHCFHSDPMWCDILLDRLLVNDQC